MHGLSFKKVFVKYVVKFVVTRDDKGLGLSLLVLFEFHGELFPRVLHGPEFGLDLVQSKGRKFLEIGDIFEEFFY